MYRSGSEAELTRTLEWLPWSRFSLDFQSGRTSHKEKYLCYHWEKWTLLVNKFTELLNVVVSSFNLMLECICHLASISLRGKHNTFILQPLLQNRALTQLKIRTSRIIRDGSGLPERVSHVVCKFMRAPLLALLLTKIVTKPNVINKFLQEKCYRSSDCTMHISFPQLSSQNKYTFLEMWIFLKVEILFVLHVLCLACR